MNIHVLWCFSLGIIEMATLLLSGWIADQNWIKKYHYHKIYLIFCGITNLLCPLATTFSSLMAYSITFAIFSGGYLALLLPVLVRRKKVMVRLLYYTITVMGSYTIL